MLSKASVSKNISALASIQNSHCDTAAVNKCCEMSKRRKFRANLVLMRCDARRTWFVSVMTARHLVWGSSEGHGLAMLQHCSIWFNLWPEEWVGPCQWGKPARSWTWVGCWLLKHTQGKKDKRCMFVPSNGSLCLNLADSGCQEHTCPPSYNYCFSVF